jgi:hypothetical protein
MKSSTALPLRHALLLAPVSLMLWQAIIIPLEYLLTEHFLIYPYVPDFIKTLILLSIIINLSLLLPLKIRLSLKIIKIVKLAVVIFSLIFLVFSIWYARFYSQLQRYPRIYFRKPGWTIQGSQIKLRGKNFGEPYLPGEVKLGDLEFQLKRWTDTEIVVEQPVTGNFGLFELQVINGAGYPSNTIQHFIKDPGEL